MSIVNKLVSYYKNNKLKTIIFSLVALGLLIFNGQIFFLVLVFSIPTYFVIKSGRKAIGQKKTCPHCKTEIDSQASKCPHCGGKIYVWTTSKKLLGVAIGVIILLISLNSGASNPKSPAQQISDAKINNAEYFSENYVETNVPLKSPSTAKYTNPIVEQDLKDPNVFNIDSHIDSQNSYGAMIRAYWSMKVKYIGADTQDQMDTGENWKIQEFTFDGDKVI